MPPKRLWARVRAPLALRWRPSRAGAAGLGGERFATQFNVEEKLVKDIPDAGADKSTSVGQQNGDCER